MKRWLVGIDVGGTFTDIVAVQQGARSLRTAKVWSRRDSVSGLLAALEAVGLSWQEVAELTYGTTLITNLIVEEKFGDVALVTTEGFADTIEIARQNRRHLYRLDLAPKALPPVPRQRRFEVRERMGPRGEVKQPLSSDEVASAVSQVVASGAKSAAVVLLHAYANPEHERRIAAELRRKLPHVALSHEINPEVREYERTMTTVLSAAVMPAAADLCHALQAGKPSGSQLHIFHSAGGMAALDDVQRYPLMLAMSGPAAGAAAAASVAKSLGLKQVLALDMGGTTTDVTLIVDGRTEVDNQRTVKGRPIRMPAVAVQSIGAGGGSIAWLDAGTLRVGPHSAGADPGPACYGRGGQSPTVSDAALLLGYLDPDRPLGGDISLDIDRAEAAVSALATEAGSSIERIALGIIEVANAAMIRQLRRMTVARGTDHRACTLMAFGGAGPMHAAALAREFGIAHVVVPANSGCFSALGCLAAEMSYTQQQTVGIMRADWNGATARAVKAELAERLTAPLKRAGYRDSDIRYELIAAVRYRGQSYAIELRDPPLECRAALGAAFRRQHEKLYGFAAADDWEVIALRLRASVEREQTPAVQGLGANCERSPVRAQPCTFQGGKQVATPRYLRTALAPGMTLTGPAVVEDDWSTTVLPPGDMLSVDTFGNLAIQVGAAA